LKGFLVLSKAGASVFTQETLEDCKALCITACVTTAGRQIIAPTLLAESLLLKRAADLSELCGIVTGNEACEVVDLGPTKSSNQAW